MEIVNIEAGTFGRMNAALEELVGKLQSERKDTEYGLEEWLDNQDVFCITSFGNKAFPFYFCHKLKRSLWKS